MSTQTSQQTSVTAQRRMPFGRWMAEVGWRHVVGILAVAFAVFPILFIVSASVNPLGTLPSSGLIPKAFPGALRVPDRGDAGPSCWYANTVIVRHRRPGAGVFHPGRLMPSAACDSPVADRPAPRCW